MTETTAVPVRVGPAKVLARWPSLAAVVFAANVSVHLARDVGLAPVLGAGAVVYLGSAALGRAASWPLFVLTVVVITAARLVDLGIGATSAVLVVGVLLGLFGVVRRPAGGVLPLQLGAFVIFGAVAATAPLLGSVAGTYVVAAGLLAHAAWGVHQRTAQVVSHPFAEFDVALDAALATIALSSVLSGAVS